MQHSPHLQHDTEENGRAIGYWRRDLTDRLRVLLHAKPLFDMRRSDSLRAEELRHYDTLVLAIRIWDLIVENMGLDSEVDRADVLRELQPMLIKMDQAADIPPQADRHTVVVRQVLSSLCNDDNRRLPFAFEYQDINEDGDFVRRKHDFRLLIDYFHPSGKTVLRLSSKAINLYLRCWSLDIEDEQAATEAVVLSQLNRGKFDEAADSARKAKIISFQYGEKIEAILRDTRRDISRVDWQDGVPKTLDEALAHIKIRTDMEASILETARQRMEHLDSEDGTHAVAHVCQLIEDCQQRHFGLHGQLMEARIVFLDEQERQGFTIQEIRFLPAMVDEVLTPILGSCAGNANQILEIGAAALFGSVPPRLLSLSSLVQWQLMPRQQFSPSDSPIEEQDLVEYSKEELRYDDETRSQGDNLLQDLDEPTLLSELLEMAGQWQDNAELQEYIVYSVLHDFAPDDDRETSVDVAIQTEMQLVSDGFYGDDVMIIPKTDGVAHE